MEIFERERTLLVVVSPSLGDPSVSMDGTPCWALWIPEDSRIWRRALWPDLVLDGIWASFSPSWVSLGLEVGVGGFFLGLSL